MLDALIIVLFVGTRISFDAVNEDVLPAMTERDTLLVLTVAIQEKFPEQWIALRLMTTAV